MDVKTDIILLIFGHWSLIHSMTISGVITEDITFLHKPFPVPPSIRAIIEVDLYLICIT